MMMMMMMVVCELSDTIYLVELNEKHPRCMCGGAPIR